MSYDWDIRCVDCGEKHGFDSMQERAMKALIRHANAIVGLCELVQDPDVTVDLIIHVPYCHDCIKPAFFKKHQGHHLQPVDEHGRLSEVGHEAEGTPHQ